MTRFSRRRFLQSAAVAAAVPWTARAADVAATASKSPSDRLRVAMIGVHNQGAHDLHAIAKEGAADIAVLCDVDEALAGGAKKEFPKADVLTDFRRIFDRKDIDAVAIGTPDHTHAIATIMALQAGKHVFCEKPLTHNIVEARKVAEAAKKYNRVTQMGTQIHASENYRRVVELIRAGAIGPVREAYVWVHAQWAGKSPAEEKPTPAGLNYDLWLGPAAARPFSAAYVPKAWRGWWDFGGGTLGDMGCHHYDLVQWALGLSAPTRVSAEGPPVETLTAPAWLTVRYEYAATGDRPALNVVWNSSRKPKEHAALLETHKWRDGTLFIGDKGMLLSDYSKHRLLPEEKFAGFTPPPKSIPKSIGHYKEWVEACKGNGTTTCPFSYSGPLTETVLLGNVAYRSGKAIDWDAKSMRIANAPEAERLLRRDYRGDWGKVIESV
jgi:predicted dehydrogenase